MKAKRILLLFLCFALFVLSGDSIISAFFVKADAVDALPTIATSDPLDDLTGATLLDEKFDASNYVYQEDGEPQFLFILEYAFTVQKSKSDDFELYFYFYNPSAKNWAATSNTVNLQYIENGETVTLPLKIVSACNKVGFERLFYKLKVDFEKSPISRLELLEALTQKNVPRVYNVVSFNLNVENELAYFSVGNEFIYQGFMKGYGNGTSDKTTLKCTSGKSEVIPIEIGTTYYRADVLNNSVNETGVEQENNVFPVIDAVDSLHSLYVAIPNDKLEYYGKVTRFRGQYIDAKTVPMLIVGVEEIYNSVKNYVGVYVGDQHDEKLNYRFYSGVLTVGRSSDASISHCGYAYHYSSVGYTGPNGWAKAVDTLQVLFRTPKFGKVDGKEAADAKFLISGEQVKKYFQNFSESDETFVSPSGAVYGKKYFESIDTEYTLFETNLEGDGSLLDLTGQIITESFWSKLFPGLVKPTVSNFYPDKDGNGGVTALHKVVEEDFDPIAATDADRIKQICNNLYISETDYEEFREYYVKAIENNCTVYLVRYKVSDYYAEECSVFDGGWFGQDGGLTDYVESTNACFVQMHVDLGLELLDVEFTKEDGVATVIPLTMSPIDFFPDITGPVKTTSDNDMLDWLQAILKVLMFVALVVVVVNFVFPIAKWLLKGIAFVLNLILTPFRWIFKRKK